MVSLAGLQCRNPVVNVRNLRLLDTEEPVGLQEVVHRWHEKRVMVAAGQVARESSQVAQLSFRIPDDQYPEHLSLPELFLPVVPREQVLAHLFRRQSGERVRGVVEGEGESLRQGDAFGRGVERMYHGEKFSSFLLREQRYEENGFPKNEIIYTLYIVYIPIFVKKKIMGATVTHRIIIIDLKEDTFKALSVMAARQGTNLKKLIENLLDKTAEEYDDSEAYRYLSENYPDGKVKLEEKERKEFMDWLGVVEK